MKNKPVVFAVILTALTLTACGGGGGSQILTESELQELERDPRIVQLTTIAERADTLLLSSLHLDENYRVMGQRLQDRQEVAFSCRRSRCVGSNGTVFTIDDFGAEIDLTEVSIGERGGFNTLTVGGRYDPRDLAPAEVDFTRFPDLKSYGLWGTYGYAFIEITSGSVSGRAAGNFFEGEIDFTVAYAVGAATESNPSGIGGVTWRGIVEAASTRTFSRRTGTATVSIADLTDPKVNVHLDLTGVGLLSWDDVPLIGGRYETGIAGRNHIVGDFHGPDHGETYGIFDTGTYVGAFGARRNGE